MKRWLLIIPTLIFAMPLVAFGQKNCNNPLSGFVPLPELTGKQFRGYPGGLYPNGNVPSGDYLADALESARNIVPLNTEGKPDAGGLIVMAGVGASNPRTEFNAFMSLMGTAPGLNPSLRLVNTCIGGQGIQKMNQSGDNYWNQTSKLFDSLGYSMKQVQVIWVETENTQNPDTAFPRAPMDLTEEIKTLLQTMKQKFPNARLCYLSARGYSGWVDPSGGTSAGKGLLHPRDYYNGWAIKWLIEKADSGIAGYRYEGATPDIMLPLFASYHYSDGETPRNNGFYLDCETDIGNDGLHLSPAGEAKIGQEMYNFFMGDTVAKGWMMASTTSINPKNSVEISIYPNPTNSFIRWEIPKQESGEVQVIIYNHTGQIISNTLKEVNDNDIDIRHLTSGIYYIGLNGSGYQFKGRFVKAD